jgi:hypothetical protein
MALRNIDDLFEMLPASASIQGPLSIGCPHGDFRAPFKIYERALVIACPILLLFAHHCGIARHDGGGQCHRCRGNPGVSSPPGR